jgi:hypothetical protein
MAVTPCGLNGPRISRDEGGVNAKPILTLKGEKSHQYTTPEITP